MVNPPKAEFDMASTIAVLASKVFAMVIALRSD
jgi:hypothetical protein